MRDLGDRPALKTLVARQLALWPEHTSYAETSFAERPEPVLDISERVAALVLALAEQSAHGLDGFCGDYRFLCEQIMLPEELYFRRHGRYRLSLFSEAYQEWYANDEKMSRYMIGVLVSQLFWDPHARAIEHFVNRYLPSLPPGADHLEFGPGHGLLLFFAARQQALRNVAGWDVSPTSIQHTRAALNAMGVERPITLRLQDLAAYDRDAEESFDSVTLSEILEHVEDPVAALRSVYGILRPGGQVWINVPVNSPAPDHIFLLRTPEEACELPQSAGFEIVEHAFFPMTGKTLEKARREELSISCVIRARRPSDAAERTQGQRR